MPNIENKSYLLALGTDQGTFVLSLEEIDNDAVVSLFVTFPRGDSVLNQFFRPSSFPVGILDIGFLQNPVQIFVKPIEKER